MKSKKMLLAGLFVAGLIASALAFGGKISAEEGGCCDKICAPLCCPGN